MSTSFQKMEDTGAHLLYYEVYGNNNNNPKCKRTIRCLNIKLNFGKDTSVIQNNTANKIIHMFLHHFPISWPCPLSPFPLKGRVITLSR